MPSDPTLIPDTRPDGCPECGHRHERDGHCEICERWTKLGGRMACGMVKP